MPAPDIDTIVSLLRRETKHWRQPVTERYKGRPFQVLMSCLISLRTKDAVTEAAGNRLLQRADDTDAMLTLSENEIARLIYPAGFYRTKAKNIKKICRLLVDKYAGRVPDDIESLLTLPGVGRKTANLTVTLGHGRPGICVDIHVHRILNRLGYVRTTTPDATEARLRAKLPRRHWRAINNLLVAYGQNLCVPVSPFCSRCVIRSHCRRIGVDKSR